MTWCGLIVISKHSSGGFIALLSVAGGTAAITDSTLGHNQALGGNRSGGGNGGNGFGAAFISTRPAP
jgi:hypothetical protein